MTQSSRPFKGLVVASSARHAESEIPNLICSFVESRVVVTSEKLRTLTCV